MAQRNGTGRTRGDTTGPAGRPEASAPSVLARAGRVGQSVSFWSAIVLPFVAIALLASQPAGWVPALVAVLAVDVGALFLGHCHDREC